MLELYLLIPMSLNILCDGGEGHELCELQNSVGKPPSDMCLCSEFFNMGQVKMSRRVWGKGRG